MKLDNLEKKVKDFATKSNIVEDDVNKYMRNQKWYTSSGIDQLATLFAMDITDFLFSEKEPPVKYPNNTTEKELEALSKINRIFVNQNNMDKIK